MTGVSGHERGGLANILHSDSPDPPDPPIPPSNPRIWSITPHQHDEQVLKTFPLSHNMALMHVNLFSQTCTKHQTVATTYRLADTDPNARRNIIIRNIATNSSAMLEARLGLKLLPLVLRLDGVINDTAKRWLLLTDISRVLVFCIICMAII